MQARYTKFFGRPVNKLNYKMKDTKKDSKVVTRHNMNILDP